MSKRPEIGEIFTLMVPPKYVSIEDAVHEEFVNGHINGLFIARGLIIKASNKWLQQQSPEPSALNILYDMLTELIDNNN